MSTITRTPRPLSSTIWGAEREPVGNTKGKESVRKKKGQLQHPYAGRGSKRSSRDLEDVD